MKNFESTLPIETRIWNAMTPVQRYELVMSNFTADQRKGMKGFRMMMAWIKLNINKFEHIEA